MGIVKAVISAVGGALADQWLEVFEPDQMGDNTVFTRGVEVRTDGRNANRKGSSDTVSNGSVIHVYPNQFMMLIDGGKIVDYTAEEGYYTVNNSSLPSLFNGQFGETLKESFSRIRYGGTTPTSQKVFYINLQEIKGIKFGTRNPINYFDSFYNSELFLRAHGTYSIKIKDPIKFYSEAIPKDKDRVQIDDINEQYLSEFLEALQGAINQMSAEGTRVSFVPSKGPELSKFMSTILDESWDQMRGMEVQAVGIASISYDDESTKLINMRNQGAMLSDPGVREGYVQGAVARGMEAAGSNAGGSMAGFMGMGMGMNAAGNFMGATTNANMQQMQMNQQAAGQQQAAAAAAAGWACPCGATANMGKFCAQCGKPKPQEGSWTCTCGAVNTGKFCAECGKPCPGQPKCQKCGHEFEAGQPLPKFCPECGTALNPTNPA